jgi:hypothetical protein
MLNRIIITIFFTFIIAQTSFAQTAAKEINVEEFCAGSVVTVQGQKFTVKEDGFCNAVKEAKEDNEKVDADFVNSIKYSLNNLDPNGSIAYDNCYISSPSLSTTTPSNPWEVSNLSKSLTKEGKSKVKLRFYASHSFTQYANADLKFKSSRINGTAQNVPIAGRDGHHWFTPKTFLAEGNNPLQMLDEPSNTFTIGITLPSKKSNPRVEHEIIVSMFHPKEVYGKTVDKPGSTGEAPVRFDGVVDGTAVNGMVLLNKPFDGYNQTPGEMEISRNQSTHMNMIYTVGYRPRFKILEGRAGTLVYSPGIEVGITTGQSFSAVVKEDEWWISDHYEEKAGLNLHGYGGAITNKVEYLFPGGKVGIHYENKVGSFKKKIGFLDGTQEYNMKFMGNSIGLTFMLRDFNVTKEHKKLNKMQRKARRHN